MKILILLLNGLKDCTQSANSLYLMYPGIQVERRCERSGFELIYFDILVNETRVKNVKAM